MATPKKSVLQSKTTQNALGGCAITATAWAALFRAFGLELPPEVLAALTTVTGVLLGRGIAWLRG